MIRIQNKLKGFLVGFLLSFPFSVEPTVCFIQPSGAVSALRISTFDIFDNSCIRCRYFLSTRGIEAIFSVIVVIPRFTLIFSILLVILKFYSITFNPGIFNNLSKIY